MGQDVKMAIRVAVAPPLLAWAVERSRSDRQALAKRFPNFAAWEAGAVQPTFKQLEAFAGVTHTSVGLLLLPTPPADTVPLPDFRTLRDAALLRPSADLLDVVHL